MGDHRLMPGKQTAFETDIGVPLIVTGPDVTAGKTVTNIVQNIDLYPTFVLLGRASVPPSVDGVSLVPLFGTRPVPFWGDAALIEHHGPDFDPNDPDAPLPGAETRRPTKRFGCLGVRTLNTRTASSSTTT